MRLLNPWRLPQTNRAAGASIQPKGSALIPLNKGEILLLIDAVGSQLSRWRTNEQKPEWWEARREMLAKLHDWAGASEVVGDGQ
jgi:hypothetical protein